MDEHLKTILGDLWKDKPLFLAFAVGIAGLIWLIVKRGASTNTPASTPASAGAITPGGVTYISFSPHVEEHPTGPPTGTSAPTTPALPIVTTGVPRIGAPIVIATDSTTTTTPAKRTVTVTPWGTKYGSLFDIAQAIYGNGNLWPKIFDANRDKISNPNLIYAGQELVVP